MNKQFNYHEGGKFKKGIESKDWNHEDKRNQDEIPPRHYNKGYNQRNNYDDDRDFKSKGYANEGGESRYNRDRDFDSRGHNPRGHQQLGKHWGADRRDQGQGHYEEQSKRDQREGHSYQQRDQVEPLNQGRNHERVGYNERRGDEGRRYPDRHQHDTDFQGEQRGRHPHEGHQGGRDAYRSDHRRGGNHRQYQEEYQNEQDQTITRGYGNQQEYGRGGYDHGHRGNKNTYPQNDHQNRRFDNQERGQHPRQFGLDHSKSDNKNVQIEATTGNNETGPQHEYRQGIKNDSKQLPKRFNKDSKEFSINPSTQPSIMIPSGMGLSIPSALGMSQSPYGMPAMKEGDQQSNLNNYSNNLFNQTIYINQLGQPVNASGKAVSQATLQAYSAQMANQINPTGYPYGYGMSVENQLGMGMMPGLQGQMSPAHLAGMNSAAFYGAGMPQMNQGYPDMNMGMMNPQMMEMMNMMQPGYSANMNGGFGQSNFGGELDDESMAFMNMLQMFRENMGEGDEEMEEDEDVDQLLEEAEFERRQEEAEKFDELSRDCNCCKGYPLKCRSTICDSLGMCHCLLRRNKEEEVANRETFFIEEQKNCSCCKGYIKACKGAACVTAGQCNCMI